VSTRPNIKGSLSLGENLLSGSPSSRLDCEVLLAYILEKDRSYLRAWPEKNLSDAQLKQFLCYIEQRQKGRPIAHLLGEREFWSRDFFVSKDVLIPRPDTELLIDVAQQKFQANQSFKLLDLGTGSGIIAITLALEFKRASVTAVDASQQALTIAKKNAARHCANHIEFINSDWFNDLSSETFDLIVSNPPYICSTDCHLLEGDVRFEPSSALVSEKEGLRDIEHIISNADDFLAPNGYLLLEHGYQQGSAVKNLLELSSFVAVGQFQDLQGHTRATLGQKPSTLR